MNCNEASGGSFSDGAMTAAMVHLFNDELVFDGSKLRWMDDDGNEVESWNAVSGKLKDGSTSPSMQRVKNKGPIPEGDYTVDPENTNSWSLVKAIGGWGSRDSWGSQRTIINPQTGTNTHGRDQMYIHGGADPGSAGCIDLTGSNDAFHQRLQDYGKPINLEVNYGEWYL